MNKLQNINKTKPTWANWNIFFHWNDKFFIHAQYALGVFLSFNSPWYHTGLHRLGYKAVDHLLANADRHSPSPVFLSLWQAAILHILVLYNSYPREKANRKCINPQSNCPFFFCCHQLMFSFWLHTHSSFKVNGPCNSAAVSHGFSCRYLEISLDI